MKNADSLNRERAEIIDAVKSIEHIDVLEGVFGFKVEDDITNFLFCVDCFGVEKNYQVWSNQCPLAAERLKNYQPMTPAEFFEAFDDRIDALNEINTSACVTLDQLTEADDFERNLIHCGDALREEVMKFLLHGLRNDVRTFAFDCDSPLGIALELAKEEEELE